ncbi:MAG: bacteriohemerythrin [Sulfuritalea sp.]|jgi:hemerythrin|nr:bacteriohemerythrin [Sulfuritalea sp.]
MAMAWASYLETGIEVIDQQHMRIVDYINRLEQAIDGADQRAVGRVLNELEDYCLSHFAFEESLQQQVGYKFAAEHKSTHENFTKRLTKYRERHKAGEDVARQLHAMLGSWLVHHIKRDDMAYVSDLKGGIEKQSGDWLTRSVAGFFGKNA